MTASIIHCPNCNGANEPSGGTEYECQYCLTPFSVQQAESEESRLQEQLKSWMQEMVGAAGGGASVDASSRAWIFKDKVFPALRRDVDRSLESLGSYNQFALVGAPIPMPGQKGSNPLVSQRAKILGLRDLKARLAAPQVTSFAVTDRDRIAINELERRVVDFMHLSNVADAAARRAPIGYRTARANLELVLNELNESIVGDLPHDQRAFLAMLKTRYSHLVELTRVCEVVCSDNPIDGASLAARLDAISAGLGATARAIEGQDYAPADTMPMVIAVDGEAGTAALLARWLRAYDDITRPHPQAFLRFVAEVSALYSSHAASPTALCDLVEGCATLFQYVRGEQPVGVAADSSWLDEWAESQRKKKVLFVFGTEEERESVETFLLPVWVADVRFSRDGGQVFAEGTESRGVALVEAVQPTESGVVFFPSAAEDEPCTAPLTQPTLLGASDFALPTATRGQALQAITASLKRQGAVRNPNPTIRCLAFVSASVVKFTSKDGDRSIGAALAGKLAVNPATITRSVHAARQALQSFN